MKNYQNGIRLARLWEIWKILSAEQKRALDEKAQQVVYERNKLIYRLGETPVNLMCLLHGKVKIFKKGISGRNQIVRVIEPQQYFGYRAYFAEKKPEEGRYLTNAAAFEKSTVLLIPLTLVEGFMKENYELCRLFIRLLSVDLGIADERTVNLTQKHVRSRLAEALLFLRDSYGMEGDKATLSIYLGREDLANLSNMTAANASRTLKSFVSEKIIAVDGRKIKLIDDKKLERISRHGD